MKSVEQILSRLESLSGTDRQWIVERLPDNAKTLLMNELTSARGATTNARVYGNDTSSNDDQIERILPSVAAAILEAESVWVITCLLQSANKSWAMKVVNSLPVTLRSSVVISMRESNSAPTAVVVSLRNTLLRHASMEQSSAAPVEVMSWWRQLIRARRGYAT